MNPRSSSKPTEEHSRRSTVTNVVTVALGSDGFSRFGPI